MSEKRVVGVNQCRRGTESDWKKAVNFSPKDGEIIVYKPDENHVTPRFKVGDGITNVNDLPFSDGEGYNTIAGGKGFTIISASDNNDGTGTYTLSSVTGLEVGMRYSAVLSSANYNAGTITAINDNTVTVNGYKHIELNGNVDDPENFNVYNCFLVVDRPDLGDKEVGFNAHAEGEGTISSNKDTHAEGYNTRAIGKFAHAEGSGTIAGHGAHAEGGSTQALGDLSHSEGNRTKATGNYSHSEGNNTVASAQGTHAEGIKAQAIYNAAHAEGQNTLANGLAAHAEGESTIAKFTGSHAEGVSTQAIEEAAHAEGYNAQATAKAAHAEGENTVASAKRAHAEGYSTTASELNAHAEGKLTTASAEEAHAEGISTIASGAYAHAEGNTTQALSEAAHAEGKETIAQGIGAHAEGSKSKATNNMAHAEGSNTEASGEKSHAEGNSTKATGTASHAEGDKTEAKGYASHAGGQSSIASNAGSFVHGTGLKTNSNNQAVVGAYNKTYDSQYAAFIVGNGKEDARSNALAVMKSGDTYVKGDLYVGGTPEGDEGTGIVKVATEDETHLYAETAANNAAERVKNELLNGAGDAYDTLKELGDLIEENKDAFEVVTDLVNNKADQNTVANAYKKTVSSGYANLTITDHSPVPHMMRLASESKTNVSEVEQYNKNLLNMESFLGGALVQREDGSYDLRYSNGNTYVSAWNRQKLVYLNDRITISLEIVEHVDVLDGNLKLQIQTEDGNHWVDFPVDVVGRQSKTITAKGNVTQMQFFLASSNGQTAGIVFKDVQLEFGNIATDYIPYQKASYIVDNVGVDAPALYPITYFVFKSYPFTCTYNQDINHMLDNVMSTTNPKGTGSFSMNRQAYTTVGENSVAVGYNTEASGQYSFAEGMHTEATGRSSHAEGNGSKALNYSAHAGGYYSIANKTGSFAHGDRVTADADYQTTFGTTNEVNINAAFIIGNGDTTVNGAKNAFEVNKDGNTYVQQSLFVGGTGANQEVAKEVATKEYVDTQVEKVNICTNQSLTSQEKDSARTNIGAQKKITGAPGQFVVIGDDGNVTTRTILNAEEVIF